MSLAMYHGLGDDFRSVFGQLRPFSFLFFFLPPSHTPPLFLFKVPEAKVWARQRASWTC